MSAIVVRDSILTLLENVRRATSHQKARYEGDGDPGCSGSCPRCDLDEAIKLIQNPKILLG